MTRGSWVDGIAGATYIWLPVLPLVPPAAPSIDPRESRVDWLGHSVAPSSLQQHVYRRRAGAG